MSRKKGLYQKEKPKGLPLWIGTFGGLMSLLLTFFILLLSMATFDKQKVEAAIGSVQGALSILENGPGINLEESQDGFIITIPDDLLFDTDSAVLNGGKLFLQRLSMELDDDMRLHTIGNTDNVPYKAGSQMDNRDLSKSLSGIKSLISLGVPSSIMQVDGDGEFNPKDSNATPFGRSQNRMVHFSFVGDSTDDKQQDIINKMLL